MKAVQILLYSVGEDGQLDAGKPGQSNRPVTLGEKVISLLLERKTLRELREQLLPGELGVATEPGLLVYRERGGELRAARLEPVPAGNLQDSNRLRLPL